MTKDREQLDAFVYQQDGVPLIEPCLSVTLYFLYEPKEILQDFAEQAMQALDAELTYFHSGAMRNFGKRSDKSASQYAFLFEKRRPRALSQMIFRATDRGASASQIHITSVGPPEIPQDDLARARLQKLYDEVWAEQGAVPAPQITSMVVSFGLDHPLADPQALLGWIKALEAIKTGQFLSGHAGYTLNIEPNIGHTDMSKAMGQRTKAALSRHPGLGYEIHGPVAVHLQEYIVGTVEFIPRIKRVNWLTFTPSALLTHYFDGRDALRARVSENADVVTHDAGDGLIIQAGPEPRIGDVTQGDNLPTYRFVAKSLAPASMPRAVRGATPFTAEEFTIWLNALSEDNAD